MPDNSKANIQSLFLNMCLFNYTCKCIWLANYALDPLQICTCICAVCYNSEVNVYSCYSLLDVPKSDGITNLKLHSVQLIEKNLKQFTEGTTTTDGAGSSTPSNTGSTQAAKKYAISQFYLTRVFIVGGVPPCVIATPLLLLTLTQ